MALKSQNDFGAFFLFFVWWSGVFVGGLTIFGVQNRGFWVENRGAWVVKAWLEMPANRLSKNTPLF
jgi:hypothetical protein